MCGQRPTANRKSSKTATNSLAYTFQDIRHIVIRHTFVSVHGFPGSVAGHVWMMYCTSLQPFFVRDAAQLKDALAESLICIMENGSGKDLAAVCMYMPLFCFCSGVRPRTVRVRMSYQTLHRIWAARRDRGCNARLCVLSCCLSVWLVVVVVDGRYRWEAKQSTTQACQPQRASTIASSAAICPVVEHSGSW